MPDYSCGTQSGVDLSSVPEIPSNLVFDFFSSQIAPAGSPRSSTATHTTSLRLSIDYQEDIEDHRNLETGNAEIAHCRLGRSKYR